LLGRFVQKVVLDATGFVHLRNPCEGGGFYYCFNAVTTHVKCFVAAALYSAYSTGTAPGHGSYGVTGSNYTNANVTSTTVANTTAALLAKGTAADYAGKIDDFTVFAMIMTLSALWALAFVSLLLTMKREHVGTFVSLQTGCAYARSQFLDHPGDDTRRVVIFYSNERRWRSIRDLVRQWVLGAYAILLQLSPAWLNDALRALIPDDYLPAPVVQQLDARAPGGRRRSIANMGALQRVSLAFAGVRRRRGRLRVVGRQLAGGRFAGATTC
jgi:hypothetical protein